MSHLKIKDILNDRNKTHGTFQYQAATSQALKDLVVGHLSSRLANRADIDASLVEAVEMICVKMSRLSHGNPYEKDHWLDIVGYAQLVVDILDKVNNTGGPLVEDYHDDKQYYTSAYPVASTYPEGKSPTIRNGTSQPPFARHPG